jgi:SAM-dependent methyltransferase
VSPSAPKSPQDAADRWFDDWFREDYLLLYRHRDDEEARGFLDRLLPELDVKPPDWLLDLACGAGRHSHYLASKGFRVVGFDLSRTLLAKAATAEPASKAYWIQGDMRALSIRSQSISTAVNLFTSFGYFLDDRDDITVLREVSRLLKPGGWFVLDTLNPDFVESTLELQSIHQYSSEPAGAPDIQIIEERAIDRQKHRVVKTILIRRGDQTKTYIESVRMYSVEELHQMLTSVSLKPVILWGDYRGSEYNPKSPRIIIVARANA